MKPFLKKIGRIKNRLSKALTKIMAVWAFRSALQYGPWSKTDDVLVDFPYHNQHLEAKNSNQKVTIDEQSLTKSESVNYTDKKFESHTVQLDSSTLIFSKTAQCSEGEKKTLLHQLNKLEEQRELYGQILDQDDQLVIPAGLNDKPRFVPGPSNFPVSPPSGGQPSGPVKGVNPYRTTPKMVDQGLGGAANPAGSGGGSAEFDETGSARSKQKGSEINSKHPSFYSNQNSKKQSSDQCGLDEELTGQDKKYGGFDYKIDKNGNPILLVTTKDGSEIFVTYDQALAKYYHQDVYSLQKPKDFNSTHARSLKHKDKLEYLKKTVPRDKVIEFQIANAKSLATENLRPVPGFVGLKKEPGTLYINEETGQIHFVNDRTKIWRTTVRKTQNGLIYLAENDFHLFPNAGD